MEPFAADADEQENEIFEDELGIFSFLFYDQTIFTQVVKKSTALDECVKHLDSKFSVFHENRITTSATLFGSKV